MRTEVVIAKNNPETPNSSVNGPLNQKNTFLKESQLQLGSTPFVIRPENPQQNTEGKFPFIRPINAEVFTQANPEKSLIDLTRKEEVYNPSKRARKYVDHRGRLIIRPRRRSRCDGVHDAEADPCGSPRCRTKGRQKIDKSIQTKAQNREKRQKVILNPKTRTKV